VKVGELPWPVRVGFYGALLAALAVADRASDSVWPPLGVLAAFLLAGLPVLVKAFAEERESMPRASGQAIVGFAAVLTVLTTIEVAVIPDYGLGALFWIVATLIPAFEALGYLARREARVSS
jgi:hypothetical protein